jgi:hypothetical protein
MQKVLSSRYASCLAQRSSYLDDVHWLQYSDASLYTQLKYFASVFNGENILRGTRPADYGTSPYDLCSSFLIPYYRGYACHSEQELGVSADDAGLCREVYEL